MLAETDLNIYLYTTFLLILNGLRVNIGERSIAPFIINTRSKIFKKSSFIFTNNFLFRINLLLLLILLLRLRFLNIFLYLTRFLTTFNLFYYFFDKTLRFRFLSIIKLNLLSHFFLFYKHKCHILFHFFNLLHQHLIVILIIMKLRYLFF